MPHTVLIADSDDDLVCSLAGELAADGYRSLTACAPTSLAITLGHSQAKLIILGDFDGPGANARLLADLRGGLGSFPPAAAGIPVIVLSSQRGQVALLRCFDAGADDYIAKPASYLELRARVGAILARSTGQRTASVHRVGALELDKATHRATYGGRPLELSQTEWRLLAQLAEQPGRVYSKQELLRDVWGYQTPGVTRTVDAFACRLRRKLHDAGAIDAIANTRGVGYALATKQTGSTAR